MLVHRPKPPLAGYYLLMEQGVAPAPAHEWTVARFRRAFTLLADSSALRRQWRLRVNVPAIRSGDDQGLDHR